MRARLLISSLVALLGVVLLAAPAAAKSRAPAGDAWVDDNGNPTVDASDQGGPGGDGGGGAADPDCHWEVVVSDDSSQRVFSVDGVVQLSATGRWLKKVCKGKGAVPVGDSYLIPEGGVVDVQALAQQARASVSIAVPGVNTSPDAGGRLYVQIPTWLWVDGGWWRTYQASASAGRVTATVTARPVQTSWALGDSAVVTCNGPGIAWRAGLPENATNCSHTYTRSSAGSASGTFTISATVTIEITWTSNVGQGGTLAPISRASSRTVEVGEIQAIGTGS